VKPLVERGGRLWMTDGRLPGVTGFRLHADNAVAMWEALAGASGTVVRTPRIRIIQPSGHHVLRAIILDPGSDHAQVVHDLGRTMLGPAVPCRRLVEDPSGQIGLHAIGFAPYLRMPVMVREAGPVPAEPEPCGAIEVIAVDNRRLLAEAERILATVFPPARSSGDWEGTDWAGQIQPLRVLDLPGWRVWLGCREGVPACAAFTYHDGTSVGLYQVGTLAEHRGQGVARALVEAILRAHPDVPASLTATEPGRPLYERLGFRTVSHAVWWTPDPTGDDIGSPLR
jgi:GNAT superfamily N-acetyltransferase